jgi:hypothetical protein
MMASMGPILPSTGTFGIKLVDNDYHDELRILYFGRGGEGRKRRDVTAVLCLAPKFREPEKKLKAPY